MKKICLFLVFIIFSTAAFGQKLPGGKVTGIISDLNSKAPFSGATAAVYTVTDSVLVSGAATDNAGKFVIMNIPAGKYYLQVKYLGYDSRFINFALTPDKPDFEAGNIPLSEATVALTGVNVVATRPQVIYQDDKKILKVDEYRKTGATTLAQVLQNAPSVTTDAEGNVFLRGSSNFTLLIDGKPAPNTGTNMLRQIPPEMVESVEIMTNPSAKYDPDGVSGIINLVLKKQKEAGFNGMITAMAGLGNKFNGDAQFNYRKNKINLFAGISGTSYQTDISGLLTRSLVTNDGDLNVDTHLEQAVKVNTMNVNAGIDINFNDRNSLTISSRQGPVDQAVVLENRIFTNYVDLNTKDYALYRNLIGLNGFFYNPNITYTHKFKKEGQKLTLSLFTGGFDGDLTQGLSQRTTDQDWIVQPGNADQRESDVSLNFTDTRFKADFESKIGKAGKLEAGLQSVFQNENTGNVFRNYNNTTLQWEENTAFTNKFNFRNLINSAYATWSGKFGKYSYQAGLRGELNNRIFDQKTLGQQFNYDKLSLFPSGSLTKTLPKDQQLQLSFSRRINRPGRNSLNPFPQFIDYQTVAKGNPYVRPEYINALELSYQKRTKTGFISAQGYYRHVNDIIASIVEADTLGNVTLTSRNANESQSAGTELMGNFQVTKWFRFMTSGNVYYYKLKDKTTTTDVNRGTVTWTMNSNLIFMITPATVFSLTGRYNGPSITVQGKNYGNFALNVGLNQTLMKKKASLSLGIQDLLGTMKIRSLQEENNLVFKTEIRPEYRVVTLTFTYNFNNFQRRNGAQDQLDMNILR
jgi:outer membrane receptor protein involved in Fe transport